MLAFDASKVGALHGCGVLIAHRTIPITPLYKGGGQERGLRSGTGAPELVDSFAVALRTATVGRESFRAHAELDRAHLTKLIMTAIPAIHINEGRIQAPNILNLSLLGRDTDYLVALLDEAGFSVSTRSACETDSEEGSRAVFALTSDAEMARATLRISWGPGISSRELVHFAKTLIRAVAFIDSSSQR
jgi:cysteine desulfurase